MNVVALFLVFLNILEKTNNIIQYILNLGRLWDIMKLIYTTEYELFGFFIYLKIKRESC